MKGCPFLAERIEAGMVGYGDAVQNTLSRHAAWLPVSTALIRLFPGTIWADAKISPAWRCSRPARATAATGTPQRITTAMYLLTANKDLYNKRTAYCFCKRGLEFGYALLRGIAPHDYTLFVAARDVFTGVNGLAFTDLADSAWWMRRHSGLW